MHILTCNTLLCIFSVICLGTSRCMLVWVYMCVLVQAFVCVCMNQNTTLGVFLSFHLVFVVANLFIFFICLLVCLFFRQDLPLAWNLSSHLGWPASEPQGTSCFSAINPRITSVPPHLAFFTCILGIELMSSWDNSFPIRDIHPSSPQMLFMQLPNISF